MTEAPKWSTPFGKLPGKKILAVGQGEVEDGAKAGEAFSDVVVDDCAAAVSRKASNMRSKSILLIRVA